MDRIYHIIEYFLGHIFLAKNYKVKCNICGWQGKEFIDFERGFGYFSKNAVCPSCFWHPRQRSFLIYLKKVIPKNKSIKVLHFAPELFLSKLIKSYKHIDYLSVDIDPEKAMKKEDITQLSFKDSSYDIIICSHVLEHIEDDRQAMSELYRVLKRGGFAIIDVPIDYEREKTYEDPLIITPEERTKAYWQGDHVRLYGRDFSDKLRNVGFNVKVDKFISELGEKKIKRFGLQDTPIYFCKKG